LLAEASSDKETIVAEVRRKVKVGRQAVWIKGRVDGEALLSVSFGMEVLTPVQQTMLQALGNSVNLSLKSGVAPRVIAASVRVEGHPIIEELCTFLEDFEGLSSPVGVMSTPVGTPVVKNKELQLSNGSEGKQKCRACGAAQLRRNGTCMLCEVCGETSGCS